MMIPQTPRVDRGERTAYFNGRMKQMVVAVV